MATQPPPNTRAGAQHSPSPSRALLEALGRRRGFLWREEVDDGTATTSTGDIPLLDPDGDPIGRLPLETPDTVDTPLTAALGDDRCRIPAEERQRLLARLDQERAQLHRLLLDQPGIRERLAQRAREADQASDPNAMGAAKELAKLLDWVRRGRVRVTEEALSQISATVQRINETRTALLLGNLRLVLRWIDRGASDRVGREDAILAGATGLLTGIDRFDPNRGTELSTYAVHWIRQMIRRTSANHGAPLRVPIYKQDRIVQIVRASAACWREHGREPTLAELAGATALSQEEVEDALALMTPVVETERQIAQGLTTSDALWDARFPSPSNGFRGPSVAGPLLVLERVLEELVPGLLNPGRLLGQNQAQRKALIMRGRLAIGHMTQLTLRDLGDRFSVTHERIRQIEAKTIEMARRPRPTDALRAALNRARSPLKSTPVE